MKKKLLIVYPYMMLGGSTTSLLSLLQNLNLENFEVDLQLFENKGELFDYIPKNITLLPPAKKHNSKLGLYLNFLFSGYLFKSFFSKYKKRKFSFASAVKNEFMAKKASKQNKKRYDYAIGFLEGWTNKYIAYNVDAEKKFAWIHSTFANVTKTPQAEIPWMNLVDKIVFVTDACRDAFKETLPEMAGKAITIENITDSALIRKRAEDISRDDASYESFLKADKFKILTVCRIDIRTKGLDRIVNAAKAIKASGKSFIWYVIGTGEDKERFDLLIKDASLEDCLFPIGIRMNPYPFIKCADIMCMPSRYEGKPMVITESMILGTPPIVTKYLSAHEQIKNGTEGLVLPNDDDSIIAPLIDLIDTPEKIRALKNQLLSSEYGNADYISVITKTLFN